MSKAFDWDNIENNTLAMIKTEFKRNGISTPKGNKEEYVRVLKDFHNSRTNTPVQSPLPAKTTTTVSDKLLDEPETPKRKRGRPPKVPKTPQPKVQKPEIKKETEEAPRQMSPPIAVRVITKIDNERVPSPIHETPTTRDSPPQHKHHSIPSPVVSNKLSEQIREISPVTQTLIKNKRRDINLAGFFFMLMEFLLIFIVAAATFPIHPALSVVSIIFTFFVCTFLVKQWKKNF